MSSDGGTGTVDPEWAYSDLMCRRFQDNAFGLPPKDAACQSPPYLRQASPDVNKGHSISPAVVPRSTRSAQIKNSGAPIKTGKEWVVKVRYDEGLAIHIDPEPCVGPREGAGEASAGEHSQPWSGAAAARGRRVRNEQLTAWTSCAKDEGGPLGIGFQEQVPNQSKRQRSKDVVVSVGSKVRRGIRAGEHPRDERE